MNTHEERRLILIVQNSNEEAKKERAFAELYKANKDKVFGFAYRLLARRRECPEETMKTAEDITQESFLYGWNALKEFRFRFKCCFSTYLCGIAKRRIKSLPPISPRPDSTGEENAPDPTKEDLLTLAELIPTLAPRGRFAILLRLRGYSESEAAKIMEISVDQFRGIFHRAKTTMKKRVSTDPSRNLKGKAK